MTLCSHDLAQLRSGQLDLQAGPRDCSCDCFLEVLGCWLTFLRLPAVINGAPLAGECLSMCIIDATLNSEPSILLHCIPFRLSVPGLQNYCGTHSEVLHSGSVNADQVSCAAETSGVHVLPHMSRLQEKEALYFLRRITKNVFTASLRLLQC